MKEFKVCPICKENKPKSEYSFYFKKAINKIKYQSYCKLCEKDTSNLRGKEYYKNNSENRKKYQRYYYSQIVNKEHKKVLNIEYNKRYRENLSNCYVQIRLNVDNKISSKITKQIPDLLEVKRTELKLKNKLKELNNGKK